MPASQELAHERQVFAENLLPGPEYSDSDKEIFLLGPDDICHDLDIPLEYYWPTPSTPHKFSQSQNSPATQLDSARTLPQPNEQQSQPIKKVPEMSPGYIKKALYALVR